MKKSICELEELARKVAFDGDAEEQEAREIGRAVLKHIERHCQGKIEPLPKERQELIDKAIEKMKEDLTLDGDYDFKYADWTAIEELLLFIPDQFLKGYIKEE